LPFWKEQPVALARRLPLRSSPFPRPLAVRGRDAIGLTSGISQDGFGLRPKRRCAPIAVIRSKKAMKLKSVSRDEVELCREAIDVVEIGIMLSELALETFFAANEHTADH
jgi:hypothetical protein